MKKKWIAVLLAAAMAVSAMACGKNEEEEEERGGSLSGITSKLSEVGKADAEDSSVASGDEGTYTLYDYEASGTKMDHDMLLASGVDESTLTLKKDGSAELILFGTPVEELTWEKGKLIMSGVVDYEYTLSGDTLALNMGGVVYNFIKDGGSGAAAQGGSSGAGVATAAGGAVFVAEEGIYTVRYDDTIFRPATDEDWFGDLIPLDEEKYTKIYVTSLLGPERVEEEMDAIEEVRAADPSAVEELTIDGLKAYIYKSDEDFLGYFYALVIPFEDTLETLDGSWGQVDAVYIYGYGDTEDMIYNDAVKSIMLSVDVDDAVLEAAATKEEREAAAEQDEKNEAAAKYGYGKSNPEATGYCSLEVLKETYAWQKTAGFDMTYEEFVEHFGCDGAPWFELAFDDSRHAYKWETEDGEDFLYVTFKVNDDGSETYSSCTYSTAVAGD